MLDVPFLAALKAELIADEGVRRFPYADTTGHITIGIGRNLTDTGISAAEIDLLWLDDIQAAIGLLDRHVPWWRRLTPGKQRVMINLCFNMGWPGLAGFVKFLAAAETGDWLTAAAELRNSRWWGQVGLRGPRMVARWLAPEPPACS